VRVIDAIWVASYAQEKISGGHEIPEKAFCPTPRGGEGLLVVADLADSGATVKIVRAILPKAHVATVCANPLGRPFADTFTTEVSQDTGSKSLGTSA
jgi:xanthine phosphoribosyltransferase